MTDVLMIAGAIFVAGFLLDLAILYGPAAFRRLRGYGGSSHGGADGGDGD